jgi:hypothetical protein
MPVYVMVELEPPMRPPMVPEVMKGPLTASVEVPTLDTPELEVLKRIWFAVMAVVVERPQYVSVELEPPTSAPSVPAVEKGPETLYEEVATDWSAAFPTGP